MPLLLYNTARPEFTSLEFGEVILAAARSGELDRFLFLVPTPRLLRETERVLTREHFAQSGRPIERLPLYTMAGFTSAFHDRLVAERRDVTPEVALALMQLAMHRVDLGYFARSGAVPSLGVVQKVARVINGVRADGIMPSDFEKDIEYAAAHPDEKNFDTAKLRDLHNIYSLYLRLLSSRWVDHAGKLGYLNTELARARDATFRRAFPGTHTLLVHGFSEFTQPELAMLTQLGLVKGLTSMIYFDYAKENGPLYGNFDEVHAKLVTAGYRSLDLDPLETDIPEEERRPFRHHMRRNLFRTDDRIENSSFDNLAHVYGFFNREEEAHGIAMLAKSLVLDDGIAPERICIAAFSMEPYAELLRERLAEHGVPANVIAPFRLDRNSLLTALLAALAIPANGFDRRDVIRAINSPYLDFGGEVDAAALTEASAMLRIRRGRNSWMRRIQQRIDFLEPRLAGLDDDDDRRSVELELETLERARQSIRGLDAVLGTLDRRMTPAEFRTAFLMLIEKLRAPERVLRLRHDLDARRRTPQDWQRVHDEMERDTRALAAFLRLLDEMTEFFETGIDDERRVGDGEVPEEARRRPLDFYIDHLRTAAANARYSLREKHNYGLLVAPISALQGEDFDVVILCGLVDGEFPSTYIPESFLGRPLPDAADRQLRRERVLFYSAMTSFHRRLVLSYPRFAGNTAMVRSSFIDAVLRITTLEESGRVIELDELRVIRDRVRRGESLPAGLAFLDAITTPDALAEEVGTALWNGITVPRIAEGEDLLTNLRHTAAVEMARSAAQTMGDRSLAEEYRGVITRALAPDERATLDLRRRHEFSPSQLELYARCPFKFFARRIVGAHAPATYDVSLTPLERGLLLHKVLFQLYTELRGAGRLPISHDDAAAVLERARELAREEIAGIVFDHPYWKIDQERILGSEALDGLLRQWINADAEQFDEDRSKLAPEFFEVSFGGRGNAGASDDLLSSKEGIELHNVKVRGKVDRVEIYRQGDEIFFAVADYKTGVPPTRAEVRHGSSLQLVIYLDVIRHMLAGHYNVPLEQVKPVGGIYYRLDARSVDAETKALFVPNEAKKEILALRASRNDPETVEDLVGLIRDLFERAAEYVDGIASGRFHVTTRDVNKVCRGCEYHAVCRVSQAWMPPAAAS